MAFTIVTSFLRRENAKHSVEDYKNHFEQLVAIGVPIVLFLDRRYDWTFPPHVHVIPVSLEDTWVASVVPKDAVLPLRRSLVDTRDYMLIITAKTEFVARAAHLNPFGTEWFAWVDFGIAHVFKDPVSTFARLSTLQVPRTPCIRTAGIWDQLWVPHDQVCWRFAGGFFLCHQSLAVPFDQAVRQSVLQRLPAFTWEVNTWADVEQKGMDLGWFPANHDDSIVPFTS
jgi:hypothetical protein